MSKERKSVVFSHKSPSQGDLQTVLKRSAKTATKKGMTPFLCITAQGIKATSLIKKHVDHPSLKKVLDHCYFVTIDYFYWMGQIHKHHIDIHSYPFAKAPEDKIDINLCPVFIRLTKEGEITDYLFAAGGWKEDNPEFIAHHLSSYFSDRSEKERLTVTKEMIEKKLRWDVITADLDAIKEAVYTYGCHLDKEKNYLHLACSISKQFATQEEIKEIVEFFIHEQLDINQIDKDGFTPLMEAIKKQYYDIAIMLINHGADPNIGADNYQKTPLHLAASKNHPELCRLIIEKGGDVNKKSKRGRTPLNLTENILVTNYLLDAGADVNATDDKGNTAFHYNVSSLQWNDRNFDLVKLYIKKGADLSLPNSDGMTPLEVLQSFPEKPHLKKIIDYFKQFE